MTEPARHLHPVPSGEIPADAPSYGEALQQLHNLEAIIDQLERKFKGSLLRIANLEADREAKALGSTARPVVELLHALHAAATGRRKKLDTVEREQAGVCVRQLGFAVCVKAIMGAAYDPATKPMRNGKVQRFDQFELIFRGTAKCVSFAERAPKRDPDPELIAKIGGVGVEWIRDLYDGRQR